MATTRDLGRVQPWQESAERSRARRQRAAARERGRRERRPAAGSAIVPAGVIVALLVLAVTLPSVFASHSAQASAPAGSFRIVPRTPHADVGAVSAAPVALRDICRPAVARAGYVNPLAAARVMPERIDQGVDYAGSGTLAAIGAGTITGVVTDSTGWPGAFIEYKLLGGVDAGCYVYYAEGVTPVSGLRVGESVHAGQAIATLIPHWSTGIEVGWGPARAPRPTPRCSANGTRHMTLTMTQPRPAAPSPRSSPRSEARPGNSRARPARPRREPERLD